MKTPRLIYTIFLVYPMALLFLCSIRNERVFFIKNKFSCSLYIILINDSLFLLYNLTGLIAKALQPSAVDPHVTKAYHPNELQIPLSAGPHDDHTFSQGHLGWSLQHRGQWLAISCMYY